MPGRRMVGAATLTILTHGRPAPIRSSRNPLWSRTDPSDTGEDSGTTTDELRNKPLGVSADHSRTSGRAFRPAAQPLSVPAGTTSALRRLSDLDGVALQAIVVAAFQTLLYRYGAGDEIAVGVLPDEGFSGCLGSSFLSRAHASFADDPPFRELMARGRLEPSPSPKAFPPSSGAAVSGERAGLSRFAAVFLDVGGWPPPDRLTERYDLALSVSEEKDDLRGVFFYDAEIVDASAMERLRGHFLTLLEGIVAEPDRRVSVQPLLTPEERRRILVQWNDTRRTRPSEPNVARLFEGQVERTPEAIAVELAERRWTYRELDRRSNRLARLLRSLGVTPGVLVAICMERSLETAVGVLGVLKAGAAYVPLDPEYPRERLEFMLGDSRAPVVLTDRRTEARVPGGASRVLCLDSDSVREMLAAQEDAPVDAGAGPDDLAYVIYTSGSTGKPKGVSMPHGALLNLIAWQIGVARNPAAKTVQFASLSFDVSFQEMFSTWCAGGQLLLVPEEVRRDAAAFWRLISGESVERLYLPFVALQHLAEAAESETDAPALREVITAGEQLQITPQIARLFAGGSRSLQNQYGPSESHVVTAFTLTGPPREWPTLPPIGRPIANTRIYLLDPRGQPVPIGVAGELHIGGAGVAQGYWDRPELTAERFLPDPFGQGPGDRLYKTGDLARYRADGEIEFLGRIDHQVKIRGYRVEPGEIAASLGQHPDVRESVVVAHEDDTGAKFLVAYIVPRAGRTPPSFELRSFLKGKVPEYMVASAFVSLESLPLTPSGKVDRRALPAPGASRPELERPYVAPRDTLELELAKIWEKALSVDSIGVRDDFFELGGHSLVAGRLFAAIQKSFGKNLTPTILLQAPTIEQLAALLRADEGASRWTSLVPIQTRGSRPPLFCMHAGGGTVLFYYDLSRALGPDQPVYGLQAQGLYGGQPPHAEIDEMATHYVREIRSVEPRGPYLLTGFCFGGVLAYAVARQLRREGAEVALLASFDGGSPAFDYAVRDDSEINGGTGDPGKMRTWVTYHSARLSRLGVRERLSYLAAKGKNRIRIWRNQVRALVHLWIGDVFRAAGRPLPEILRETYFRTNSIRASKKYTSSPYPGRMVLFESEGLFRDPRLGWDGWIEGGLEIHEIPVAAASADRYHALFIGAVAEPFGEVLNAASAGSTDSALSTVSS